MHCLFYCLYVTCIFIVWNLWSEMHTNWQSGKPQKKNPLGRLTHRWNDNLSEPFETQCLLYLPPALPLKTALFAPKYCSFISSDDRK